MRSDVGRDPDKYTWRGGEGCFLAHAVSVYTKYQGVCGAEFELGGRFPSTGQAVGKPRCSVCEDVLTGKLAEGIY